MTSKYAGIFKHAMELHFIGQAGREIPHMFVNDRGFVTHHATIETSGPNGEGIKSTDVKLTAEKSTANELQVGDVYSMSCKLIASNDSRPDYLYFNGATSANLSSMEEINAEVLNATLNKISVKALGTIVAKETIPASGPGGRDACMITLKLVDIDPLTLIPVTWLAKYFISPIASLECAKHMWQLGKVVHISGNIVGYEHQSFMWIIKVSCLQACRAVKEHGPVVKHRYGLRSLSRDVIRNAQWQHVIRACNIRNLRGNNALPDSAGIPRPVVPRKRRGGES